MTDNFFDFTNHQSAKSSFLSKQVSRSFAFSKIKAAVRKQTKENEKITKQRNTGDQGDEVVTKFKYTVAAVLRIDRFYPSLREKMVSCYK